MDPPSEVCARTGSMLPCPAAPESRRRASPFGAAVTVGRTEIWFTWSSGAGSPCGSASSSLPRDLGTCCRSSDPALPMLLALGHGPRHASTSSGATCGGKNSGRSRGSLAVHCCPPRPWKRVSALRSSRTFDRSAHHDFRSDARDPPDLGANNPTRSGPCDPAAKPGFLSWGCPKIAPPSY